MRGKRVKRLDNEIKRLRGEAGLLRFDAKKSFFELPVLWILIGSIAGSATILFVIIAVFSSLELDLSYKGFNGFISFFKFPLGLLALLIPVVALIASNHRSVQAKEQIRMLEQQNKFANYYRHIDEYEKYLDSHIDESIQYESKRQLHHRIFWGAKFGDFDIDTTIVDNLDIHLKTVLAHLKVIQGLAWSPIRKNIEDVEVSMRHAEKYLGIAFSGTGNEKIELSDSTTVSLATDSLQEYLRSIALRVNACATVFEFDSDFERTDAMTALAGMKIAKVPVDHLLSRSRGPMNAF